METVFSIVILEMLNLWNENFAFIFDHKMI